MEFDLNGLFERLGLKAAAARKSLEFCKGDRKATIAVINSVYLELGQVKRAMADLKNLVERLRQMHQKVIFIWTF